MHASENHETLKQLAPLKRLAETSKIVDAILFLTSATFITGENIRIDEGAQQVSEISFYCPKSSPLCLGLFLK